MGRKGQIVIISFWILAILTVLIVGIGHRVSLALRLSRYHKDRLKAEYLVKAKLNQAIAQLQRDDNTFDALNEEWAQEEEEFLIIDEERKININTASENLLIALFESFEIENAAEKAHNLLLWRGDIPDEQEVYARLGYPCKAAKLVNLEELIVVKEFSAEDLDKIRSFITVFGEGKINGNTVPEEIIFVIAAEFADSLGISRGFAEELAAKIIELRESVGQFEKKEDINIPLTGAEELNLFNRLMEQVVFSSQYFSIEVSGNVNTIKSRVSAVYNRSDKRIVSWHEI